MSLFLVLKTCQCFYVFSCPPGITRPYCCRLPCHLQPLANTHEHYSGTSTTAGAAEIFIFCLAVGRYRQGVLSPSAEFLYTIGGMARDISASTHEGLLLDSRRRTKVSLLDLHVDWPKLIDDSPLPFFVECCAPHSHLCDHPTELKPDRTSMRLSKRCLQTTPPTIYITMAAH